MNTPKLFPTILTTAAAIAALLAGPASASANCGVPVALEIDSIQFPSWPYDVGGIWEEISQGISQGKCYKREFDVNQADQVIFHHSGMWYVAQASSCDNIGAQTFFAAFYGATVGAPEAPSFVHALRAMHVEVAADDAYELSIDGVNESVTIHGQSYATVSSGGYFWPGLADLYVRGEGDVHTVDIRAWDTALNVAGMAARITLDGGSCGDYMTGQDAFGFVRLSPAPSISGTAPLAPNAFHSPPGSLGSAGAQYIWWDADATVLGEAEFSIDITAP